MVRSVVLLDADTGGFAITDAGIKAIPKPTDGLRRHLLAVSMLAQALEAGAEPESDRGELEALSRQVADLAVRRLEASAGLAAGAGLNGLTGEAPSDPNAEPHEQQPDQPEAGH